MKHYNKNILDKKAIKYITLNYLYRKTIKAIYVFFSLILSCLMTSTQAISNSKNCIEEESIPTTVINQLIVDLSTNSNIRAFLGLIANYESCAELIKKNAITEEHKKYHFLLFPTLNQYKILWGGKMFELLQYHPNKKIRLYHHWKKDFVTSSAAGRYQFIYPTWKWIKNMLKIHEPEGITIFMNTYADAIEKYKKNIKYLYDDSIISFYKQDHSFEKELFGPFFQDLGALILLYMAGKKENIDIIAMIKGGKIEGKKIYQLIASTWEIFNVLNDKNDLNKVTTMAKNLFTYMKKHFITINHSHNKKTSKKIHFNKTIK